MPYIPQHQRDAIDANVDALTDTLVNTVLDDETANYEGMLNYAITRLMLNVYGDDTNTRYSNINNAVGVLECCKLEFYRSVAAPYENQKRHENGGVFARDDRELLDTIIVNVQQTGGEGSGAPSMTDMPEDVKEAMDVTTGETPSSEYSDEFEEAVAVTPELPEAVLTPKEQAAAESEALFNPPKIKMAPNPHTNAGYGDEFDSEDNL